MQREKMGVEKVERKLQDEFIKHSMKINADSKQFNNKIRESLAIPKVRESLETRNPAGWIKNLKGTNTWSNRELEWFLAEERLLFACQSDEECDRWVCLFNFLIEKRK
jgi:hypothetical protein